MCDGSVYCIIHCAVDDTAPCTVIKCGVLFYACRSIRVHMHTTAQFIRVSAVDADQTESVVGHFNTTPQDLNEVEELNLNVVERELLAHVENWNTRGSGFVLDIVFYCLRYG